MDRAQPLKVCVAFLTGCAVILSPVYFLQNDILMGILVFLMTGVVDAVYFWLRKSDHLKGLSYAVVLSAVIIIFVTQVVTGNILLSCPLIIVAAALSALFLTVLSLNSAF